MPADEAAGARGRLGELEVERKGAGRARCGRAGRSAKARASDGGVEREDEAASRRRPPRSRRRSRRASRRAPAASRTKPLPPARARPRARQRPAAASPTATTRSLRQTGEDAAQARIATPMVQTHPSRDADRDRHAVLSDRRALVNGILVDPPVASGPVRVFSATGVKRLAKRDSCFCNGKRPRPGFAESGGVDRRRPHRPSAAVAPRPSEKTRAVREPRSGQVSQGRGVRRACERRWTVIVRPIEFEKGIIGYGRTREGTLCFSSTVLSTARKRRHRARSSRRSSAASARRDARIPRSTTTARPSRAPTGAWPEATLLPQN